MEKEDIRIRKVIMHILDTQTGQAIYSDTEMDAGPDFKDFLKGHIYRVLESDEKKAHTIIVKNVGKSNLEILDLQVFNSALGVQLKKRVLKPGASTKLKITAFGQNLKKVKGTPRVLMITNDPNNPKIIIKVKVTSKK